MGCCSRCDTKVLRPERCTVLDGKLCAACTEDMELEKKIQEHEIAIEKIHTMRRALRTTMNENHDRLIPKFPPEIISHIFLQYCPPSEFVDVYDSPLYLGAVCQKWRQLAWATPNLWTSLRIAPFEKYESNLDDLPQLIKEWLERSSTLPLTIVIEDHCDWLDICLRRNDEVINTLNKHSARWRDIHFEIPAKHLHLFSGSSQGNILRRLVLSHPFPWDKVSIFSMKSKPSPTDLTLRKFDLSYVNILWDNLTVASIYNLGVDECFELIRRAPLLETLRLQLINPSSNIFTVPNTRIVHPHLHSLELSGIRTETVVAELLDSLSLPSLEQWEWTRIISSFPLDNMISFVGCCSSRLKALTISIDGLDHHQVITFLSHLSSLEFLNLRAATPTDESKFLNLLCASTQSPLFLPHLQSLEFVCGLSFSWQSLLQIFAVPRWKTLRVKINTWILHLNNDETTKLLLELVEEGIDLSIINDDKTDLLQEYKEKTAAMAA